MLTRNGLIIRLIDIALIILFGFIAISDIKVNAQIKLPSPVQSETTESQNLFVLVKINPDETFEVIESQLTEKIVSVDSLGMKLQNLKENYNNQKISLHVLIEPQPGSIIQGTIDVLDLCTKLNITKNIA
ncbi:MAG: ExbD/TolR family protein, partial [bacterium]